jgi:hypothetical protein
MPTNILSVKPPDDPVDPVVLDALQAVEAAYPPVQSEQAALADLRQRGAGDAELGRISRITSAISMMRDPVMRLLFSRLPIYHHYLGEYVGLPSPPRQVRTAREYLQGKIREDGEAVEQLVDQTVERLAADVPEIVGLRDDIERALRAEGLRTGPGEPQDQLRALAARFSAGRPASTGAATMTSQASAPSTPRQRACDVGPVGDLNDSPVRAHLFDGMAPQPETIHAAANLSYVVAVGHDMGVFSAARAVVDHWGRGEWRFDGPGSATLNRDLYCLYRDPVWLPQERFAQVAAAVLGVSMEGLPPGSPVNSAYPILFNQLVDAFLQFIRDACLCEDDSIAGREGIRVAADSLSWNLEQHLTGIAVMQIRDLSDQLDEALGLINNAEVIEQAACGQRDRFAAIARLNGGDPSMVPNLVALNDTAAARNSIYNFIAPFADDHQTDAKRFDDAAKAAVVIRTMSNWYAGAAAARTLPATGTPEVLQFPSQQVAASPGR